MLLCSTACHTAARDPRSVSSAGNWVARRVFRGRALSGRLVIGAVSIGTAVEMFSFSARRPEHPVSRVIHGVGHAMQAGFATTEPSPGDMLVGRAAMEALLRAEESDAATA